MWVSHFTCNFLHLFLPFFSPMASSFVSALRDNSPSFKSLPVPALPKLLTVVFDPEHDGQSDHFQPFHSISMDFSSPGGGLLLLVSLTGQFSKQLSPPSYCKAFFLSQRGDLLVKVWNLSRIFYSPILFPSFLFQQETSISRISIDHPCSLELHRQYITILLPVPIHPTHFLPFSCCHSPLSGQCGFTSPLQLFLSILRCFLKRDSALTLVPFLFPNEPAPSPADRQSRPPHLPPAETRPLPNHIYAFLFLGLSLGCS